MGKESQLLEAAAAGNNSKVEVSATIDISIHGGSTKMRVYGTRMGCRARALAVQSCLLCTRARESCFLTPSTG